MKKKDLNKKQMSENVKESILEQKEIKTVALEDLMADVVLQFCENLAELGCPKKSESDMWFRYLSSEERSKIMGKLLDIMERDEKRFEEDEPFCPKCNKKKMKNGELVGCRDITKKQWEDGFTVEHKKFSQKNCPLK